MKTYFENMNFITSKRKMITPWVGPSWVRSIPADPQAAGHFAQKDRYIIIISYINIYICIYIISNIHI